jgi:catechol 2,3-dioxygenase-like lactoylglutathione lyase family enzyme
MNPIQNKIGGIFIPVSDIHKAREWYCTILGLSPDSYEILHGHICCIPMDNNGLNVVLDSKIYSEDAYFRTPVFHFNTDDIQQAYVFMKEHGVELVTDIQHGHFFNFKDPDGNLLMICKC